jgi:hypothetical protein
MLLFAIGHRPDEGLRVDGVGRVAVVKIGAAHRVSATALADFVAALDAA